MKKYFYITLLTLSLGACTSELPIDDTSANMGSNEIVIPESAVSGELLIKFKPEMTEILDQTFMSRSRGSRSGIPSTDEILEILKAYEFERVFPIDKRTEARAREAGMHLWYIVKFDKNIDLRNAVSKLSLLGEISKVQCNTILKKPAHYDRKPVAYMSRQSRGAVATTNGFQFDDARLPEQWGYINRGGYSFEQPWAKAIAGADTGCETAWEKCTGDPSVIVAVMDEGIMWNHPDLEANMWVNEDEIYASLDDNDDNGYKGDRYGYNFATDRGYISVNGSLDGSHGTHVAGTIAAVNNNGIGVSSVAGGDGTPNSGVKLMSIQIFDDGKAPTMALEARGIKYAADNGAVILQCSWGDNSALSNPIDGLVPGIATEKQWMTMLPLEKEAFDYFINNAGSPNGVIDGGLVVFAAGNESAAQPGFPGAYSKFICVGALAADYTPATYTNYGTEVDLSAPGGDGDYYGKPGEVTPDGANGGMILSTIVKDGQPDYGYFQGSSMACPHVSGIAALGLSYATKLRRHYKAEDFKQLLLSSSLSLDEYFVGEKTFHARSQSAGNQTKKMDLSLYKKKMGRMARADLLLQAIEKGEGSTAMTVPNVYVAPDKTVSISLSSIFLKGEELTYSCAVADETIATVTVDGGMMTVKGVKNGFTELTVTPSSGEAQTVVVTVRTNANDNGWM